MNITVLLFIVLFAVAVVIIAIVVINMRKRRRETEKEQRRKAEQEAKQRAEQKKRQQLEEKRRKADEECKRLENEAQQKAKEEEQKRLAAELQKAEGERQVFQGWLVPFPLIQGTWRGTLSSTWTNPETNQYPAPIPMILVVRQTFLTVSCTLFTAESESRSYSASIHIDEDSGEVRLVYSYTNRPRTTIRDRSPIHDGTVSLQILGNPPKELRGEYWTSRKTTGEINLTLSSKSLAHSFTE